MNRSQFWAMARDLKEHPENLPKYREIYRNVYPFSDGIFKMLMASEGKPERMNPWSSRCSRISTRCSWTVWFITHLAS
ncbi:hypothetical protein SAMN05720766_13811 [Fibrobacter sp. UWH9]|uniref:hypothetical protein n=1 Tax=unclassified Fibrobacter TaxID=2634177 RepID=UPI00091DC1B6|nr:MULTISPECIES: hypothetical protein [unclassified Fibrobacter]SHH91473.1 hypothetical protein SAMN05720766_13811 [Fibrobacter sp. UWH9]SHK82080.1 hypothetical protein SAMN05720764_104131 [Fibrobacter sp. UWH5]